MFRGIMICLVLACLGGGVYLLWQQYNSGARFGAGEVRAREVPAEKDNTDAAFATPETPAQKPQQTLTYDTAAQPPQNTTAEQTSGNANASTPAGSVNGVTPGATPGATKQEQAAPVPTVTGDKPTSALPVADTIAPNPPNGTVFTGTGKFQWYRQGNLTWRVNSANGTACIAFATMEEWQKELVYSHGCGNV